MIDLADTPSQRQSRRYPISSMVRFRGTDGGWHDGTTVNIGARGLLFRARVTVPVASQIDLQIALQRGAEISAHVLCSGHVVRAEPAAGADEMLLAVTIEHFQLQRTAPRSPPESELSERTPSADTRNFKESS
jgi:hypothetical protein